MPDWPTETITDQDPRYRELLVQKAEARLRFWASEQARKETEALRKGDYPPTEWKKVEQIQSEPQKVFRWD